MNEIKYNETAALPEQLDAPIDIGVWNGQLVYLQEDGSPLMLVDDVQNALA